MNAIVKKCRLRQPFYLWCIVFAAKARWRDVLPSLRRMVLNHFRTWMQTRINEKGNKVIRDSVLMERRAPVRLPLCICVSTSKQILPVKKSSTPRSTKLICTCVLIAQALNKQLRIWKLSPTTQYSLYCYTPSGQKPSSSVGAARCAKSHWRIWPQRSRSNKSGASTPQGATWAALRGSPQAARSLQRRVTRRDKARRERELNS